MKFCRMSNANTNSLVKGLGVLSVITLALLIAPVSAHANLLSPGGHVPPDTFAAPTGPTVASISGTWSTKRMSGTYFENVIAATNNTLCSGCLDFVIGMTTLTSVQFDAVGEISTASFAGFLTDVGYVVPNTGNIPDVVTRSAGPGTTIDFHFITEPIGAGQSSAELVIETNATKFTSGTISLIDQFTATVPGFAPVPEPASLAVLGGGLLGLGTILRRRK